MGIYIYTKINAHIIHSKFFNVCTNGDNPQEEINFSDRRQKITVGDKFLLYMFTNADAEARVPTF